MQQLVIGVRDYRRSQDVPVQAAGGPTHRQATRPARRPRTSHVGWPQRPVEPRRLVARRDRAPAAVLAVRRPSPAAGGALPPQPRRRRRPGAGADGDGARPGVALQPGQSEEAVVGRGRGGGRADRQRVATVAGATASQRSTRHKYHQLFLVPLVVHVKQLVA